VNEKQVRIIGAVAAFALADVWFVAGLTAAVVCALAGTAAYGAVAAGQRHSAASVASAVRDVRRRIEARISPPKPPRRRPSVRVNEPPTAESTYGW